MEMTIIDGMLTVSVILLSILFLLQTRKITDLKESIMIVAKNPARARKALKEKYGNQRGL